MELLSQISAYISVFILTAVAIFQLLLFAGFPIGEYSWGGKYPGVLPPLFRKLSLLSAVVLFFMVFVYLTRTDLISIGDSVPPAFLIWIFTILLGLSTLGNLASKSRKEKIVMTPLSGIACLASLTVSLIGN